MAEENEKAWWQPALAVFGEITGWIVAPVVISLYGGRWLDQRFDTAPWFFLGLTALAVIITMVGVVRVGSRYMKEVEKDSQPQNNNDRNNQSHR